MTLPPTPQSPSTSSAASSPPELAKAYDPQAEEPKVRAKWEAAKPFHADPADDGAPYAIVIPPPNVTAALHLGHAFNNTLQDILARYHRAKGFNTLWMPGTDHAGIATQAVVEKRVLAEEGKRRTDFTRETFVARIQSWKDEYEAVILDQLKMMGCSCDWDRTRFTMDEMCAKAVREAFFRLFKDGLIYRGKRLVNWDPVLQTAVADDEVEDVEIDGFFYYLRYPLVGGPATLEGKTVDHVTVATTRPETMLGDTAVAINPRDPRAAALRGRKVLLPIVNREIPIVEDDYVVLPVRLGGDEKDPKAQFATGFLKVTPAHDPNDWEIGQRHGLRAINVLSPTAAISKDHGWPAEEFDSGQAAEALPLLGLDRYEARKRVVEWFKSRGLLEEVKPYRHSVGHSDRSKAAIEPYLSDQWFVAVKKQISSLPDEGLIEGTDVPRNSLAGFALRAMTGGPEGEDSSTGERLGWEGQLRFYPERYAKTFQSWHENIRDWCISRQLWWGHRIPVWHVFLDNRRSDSTSITGSIRQQQQEWIDEVQCLLIAYLHAVGESESVAFSSPSPAYFYACVRSENAQKAMLAFKEFSLSFTLQREQPGKPIGRAMNAVPGFEGATPQAHELMRAVLSLRQDADVLDTWFSSGLWPLSTMGWPDPEAFAETASRGDGVPNLLDFFNPTTALCTAREIITLWVSRMVMFNLYFTGPGRATQFDGGGLDDDENEFSRQRLPFRDVFIHAMIQDGEGRKMSKSLGNGVDPRDIIRSKGTDAMRFTLAQMATQTQDVRMPVEFDSEIGANTSPKFEIGRRLCTKLWNATRFAMANLASADTEASRHQGIEERSSLRLIDRWMLSRLARTARDLEQAIATYEFANYAQTLYDLFWRDFCDWYLEGVKPSVKADAAQRAAVRAALGAIHRTFHPVMPFITETLHASIESLRVEPIAGVALPPSDLAATARWPEIDASLIDEEAEGQFARVQALVTAIREVRAAQKVNDRRAITLHVADDATADLIAAAQGVVEALAGLDRVTREAPPPGVDRVAFLFGAAEHALSDLTDAVDVAAERERLAKQKAEVEKRIANLQGRLANKAYVDKAPAKLVDETRRQLAESESELASIIQTLGRL